MGDRSEWSLFVGGTRLRRRRVVYVSSNARDVLIKRPKGKAEPVMRHGLLRELLTILFRVFLRITCVELRYFRNEPAPKWVLPCVGVADIPVEPGKARIGAPGKSGRAVFAFYSPMAPAQKFRSQASPLGQA